MTLEAFLQLPEEKPALEYEDGRITQKVSPKLKHADLQAELAALIRAFGRPRQLAMAYPELRTTFGGRSYVPDVAVFRWERIPTGPDGELVNEVFTPPDIAIEIVSPHQSSTRLIRKCLWYVPSLFPLFFRSPQHESPERCSPTTD